MTRVQRSSAPVARDGGERGVGHAVYGLYLLSPFLAGVPALIGLAMAYARRDAADPVAREHFGHQIRTAWAGATWLAAAAIWAGSAFVAGLDGVGGMVEPAGFGALAIGAAAAGPLWFLGSSVFGWTRLASGRTVGDSEA